MSHWKVGAPRLGSRRTLAALALLAVGVFVAARSAGTGGAVPPPPPPPGPRPLGATDDAYATGNVGTLAVDVAHGVLANDTGGGLQIVSHTDPSHGSLTLQPDGSLGYVPQAGFTGDDTFTYTITNAVHLYSTDLPSLGTFGGVSLSAGAFGSSLYPASPGAGGPPAPPAPAGPSSAPGASQLFYGLEDRGPNVSPASGLFDVEPIPTYDPSIALFRFDGATATLLKTIPLQDASGHPYSGLVNSLNSTGETIEDLNGHVLAQDPNGYDPEGLVALRDGTFWVSDEYGPFVTHFNAQGRQIGRLSPFDGTLPAELRFRVPNRGLEGLTITPDGKTLVAMMQSSLQQTDLNGSNAKKLVPLRVVTIDLHTGALHEYLYLLHDPATTSTAVSEITALTSTTFLVDERDGNFPGAGVYKKLWKIDLSGATDVGPSSPLIGSNGFTYDGTSGGLELNGATIEKTVKGENTAQAQATLLADGITPVPETLFLDVDGLLGSLDSQYRFFSHDKVEGVAALQDANEIVISNDSDFGISGVASGPPFLLQEKVSPATGKQDDGEYLAIDMSKVTGQTSVQTKTATVTIHVTSSP